MKNVKNILLFACLLVLASCTDYTSFVVTVQTSTSYQERIVEGKSIAGAIEAAEELFEETEKSALDTSFTVGAMRLDDSLVVYHREISMPSQGY